MSVHSGNRFVRLSVSLENNNLVGIEAKMNAQTTANRMRNQERLLNFAICSITMQAYSCSSDKYNNGIITSRQTSHTRPI